MAWMPSTWEPLLVFPCRCTCVAVTVSIHKHDIGILFVRKSVIHGDVRFTVHREVLTLFVSLPRMILRHSIVSHQHVTIYSITICVRDDVILFTTSYFVTC